MTSNHGISMEVKKSDENEYANILSDFTINLMAQKKVEDKIEELVKFHKGELKTKTTKEQGDLLEGIVIEILKGVPLLRVLQNENTSTNEIDFLIELNFKGKFYKDKPYFPNWFPDYFLIECKNYKDNANVTYVGKFHSLMNNSDINLGIFWTYHGITGNNHRGWRDATGYIKKLAFVHSKMIEKELILSVDIESLRRLKEREYNFFDWIDSERKRMIVDISSDFTQSYSHENSGKFRRKS